MVFLISALEDYFAFIDRAEPTTVLYALLGIAWVLAIWEHYLSYRQYCNYKRHRTVPPDLSDVMSNEQLEKARAYGIDKIRFNQIRSLFGEIETTFFLLIGILPWLWSFSGSFLSTFDYHNYEILQSMVFVIVFLAYSTVSDIPWSFYYNFVLEERHGFNKQSVSFFFKDKFKKLLVTLLFAVLILSLLLKIIQIGGDYFFIYAWVFMATTSLAIAIIYPNYIAPLFDRYEPLREGELRSSIERLADKINFPLAKIFVIEGSVRSAHSNAYFYGFLKAKRIVLYDTLIKGYRIEKATDPITNEESKAEEATTEEDTRDSAIRDRKTTTVTDSTEPNEADKGCEADEVLAVLCHEFGHWSLSHNVINLCISFINLFVVFVIFAALFKRPGLYNAYGFTDTRPIFIGFLIIFQYVLSTYTAVFSFLLTVLSRRFEFQADHFAVKLAHGDPLKRALKKLEMDNMTYPFSDYLYAKYHYSHPTVLERLRAIETAKQS